MASPYLELVLVLVVVVGEEVGEAHDEISDVEGGR